MQVKYKRLISRRLITTGHGLRSRWRCLSIVSDQCVLCKPRFNRQFCLVQLHRTLFKKYVSKTNPNERMDFEGGVHSAERRENKFIAARIENLYYEEVFKFFQFIYSSSTKYNKRYTAYKEMSLL